MTKKQLTASAIFALFIVGSLAISPVSGPPDLRQSTAVAVHAFNTAATQSIPNVTWTSIALDNERWDTDAQHDTVTNNTRLTCVVPGKYIVSGGISFASDATGLRYVRILQNGGSVAPGSTRSQNPISGDVTSMGTQSVIDMAQGAYVEFQVHQTRGSALTLGGPPEFGMVRVP